DSPSDFLCMYRRRKSGVEVCGRNGNQSGISVLCPKKTELQILPETLAFHRCPDCPGFHCK
ncbi:MAG: hypothetical protein OEW04_10015, partial [Nitrospirota bacterium]|nr:hypothetical protein [Nitrospirota bacterium]